MTESADKFRKMIFYVLVLWREKFNYGMNPHWQEIVVQIDQKRASLVHEATLLQGLGRVILVCTLPLLCKEAVFTT